MPAVDRFRLAQVNIGRFRAPIDDPIMKGFRDLLNPINALADRTPGFVWRLQTEDGDATAIRPDVQADRNGDQQCGAATMANLAPRQSNPCLLMNLTVWRGFESLYRPDRS